MAEQYRAHGGDQAQYHRLLFETVWRGADLSAAIAEGEQAFRLDPSLPPIDSVTLFELYSLVGMADRSPRNVPPSFVRLAQPFYNGDRAALDAQIRSDETNLWTYPDGAIGFFHLAAERDWAALNQLYDRRPVPQGQLCFDYLEAAQAIAPALRAAGRQRDARGLLGCLHRRLTIEARQKSRSWYAYAGDFEYDRATVAALNGNEKAALGWLQQAVASGWLGRPYSPVISHRPQFAFLAGNPQLAALQTQINRRIAQERREASAIFRRRSTS